MSDTSSHLVPGPLPDDPASQITRDRQQADLSSENDSFSASRSIVNPSPRIWPGVVLVVLQWLCIKVPGFIEPGTMVQFLAMFWGPMFFGLGIVLWWLFASRIRWRDSLLILLAFVVIGGVATVLMERDIRFMGPILFGLPWATTAWVGWLLLTIPLSWPVRRAGLPIAFALAWGLLPLLRFEGVDGSMDSQLAWRWTQTAEERYLAEKDKETPAAAPLPAGKPLVLQPGDWPAFRGANRDARLTGVRIATDWSANPPKLLWKQLIGPGWSSFTVIGKRLYTQEQRGQSEAVVCLNTDTGKEQWVHKDDARFSEIVAGPGPRATPTFHAGKLYTLGASGKLNCFDAATGKVLWSSDIVEESGAKVPQWGFASSPLVAHGIVTVYAGAADGKSMLGYKADTGKLAWSAGDDLGHGYCSPQLAKLDGVEQVLIVAEKGVAGFDPTSGKVLAQHDWSLQQGMARVVQPAIVSSTDVLIGTGFGHGTRRVTLSRYGKSWTDKEVWTTQAIKPYYNDLVVYKDHLYGFDGPIFTCIALEDGKGTWRARGYGNGQVLLLADQGLLLVLSEQGEVALLKANPEKHERLGRFQAIKGKTWNHPVLAHGKLFVRNGEEAACFALPE
jgi:outer membrane protein assembly factor BamB